MTVQLKRGGTKLTAIPNHAIWLECACGRSASVHVAGLLASDKPPRTVADVVARVRCRRCGVKGAKDFRIVYQPASDGAWNAMQGAEQRKDCGSTNTPNG